MLKQFSKEEKLNYDIEFLKSQVLARDRMFAFFYKELGAEKYLKIVTKYEERIINERIKNTNK